MENTELTMRHHIVQNTLIPVIAIGSISILISPAFYLFEILSFGQTLALPWGVFSAMMIYLAIFGEYVMPHGVYKDIKSGEI